MTDRDRMPWRRRQTPPQPPKPATWHRWFRKALIWLVLLFLGGTLQGFFLEPPLQERMCRWDALTPVCSRLGLGRLPSKAEQRDFAQAQARGTPEALNAFRDQHKDSPLDADALRALARCRDVMMPVRQTFRLPLLRTQPLTVAGQAEPGAETLATAGARAQCQIYVDGGAFRLIRVTAERERLDCATLGDRKMCTWVGTSICDLEELRPVKRCDPAASR